MYLLYEHHKDSSGNLLATDMLMTSWFPGKPGIAFKKPAEAAFFEFTKHIFKAVTYSQRAYDPDTKIWSFFGTAGQGVYAALKSSPMASIGLNFERIESLSDSVKAGYVGRSEKAFVFDPTDFFYTPEAPKPSGPSRSDAEKELKLIFGLSPNIGLECLDAVTVKKHYRAAALRLHPDRNAGDSSGMTTLNYFWQIFNKGV